MPVESAKTDINISNDLTKLTTAPAQVGTVSFKARRIIAKEAMKATPGITNIESQPTVVAAAAASALA